MSTTKNNLSGRFFYINKDATPDENIGSRMYPMDELLALHMDDATSLHITFDDIGVDDHTVVDITIESGKGREAIKEVIDAMNSTQQIVTLVDRAKQQSVISYWNKGGVAVYEGSVGTFALSGSLTVAGDTTLSGTLGFASHRVTAATDGLVLTGAHVGVVTVDTSGGKIDLTLPEIDGNAGMWYKVILIGTGTASDIRTASSENKIKGRIIFWADNSVPQTQQDADADLVTFLSDATIGTVLDFWCDGTFWNLHGIGAAGGAVDKTTLTRES